MKAERIVIAVLALALMLVLGVQLGQAQFQSSASAQPPEPDAAAATLNDNIPIQGRLTDAAGNPLNGTHTVHFRLYNGAAGGPPLCENLDTSVDVTRGLFYSTLALCDAANAIEGDQLYLGVQVGADPEMTPRQPIYGVPYAFGLKPGAKIKGATSYITVPGTAFMTETNADTTRWDASAASVQLRRGATAGTKNIRIPITLPAVLYGQPVRITSMTVYYKCQNGANNYITSTALYKQTDADSYDMLVNDTTDHISNTASSYTLTTDSAVNTLSATQGLISARLSLSFANDADYVQITGIRLTIQHNY